MSEDEFDFDVHKKVPRKKDEFLLDSLRAYSKQKDGQYFGVKEWDRWTKKAASSQTYYLRFGGWPQALRKAGLVAGQERDYDPEFLIEKLKECWRSLDHPPSTSAFERWSKSQGLSLSSGPYRRRWGSIAKASDAIHKHHRRQIDDYQLYNPPRHPHQQRKTIKPGIRYDIMERDNFSCVLCGRKAPEVELDAKRLTKFHIDHWNSISDKRRHKVPANVDLNDPDNLVTLCEDCNLGKSDKPAPDIDLNR